MYQNSDKDDTDNPYMYTVVTRVLDGETCIDDYTRPTHGVRRMESYGNSTFLESEDIYTVNYQYPEKPENMPFIITEHSMDWFDGNGFAWSLFDYNNEVNYTRTDNVFYSGMYDIFRIEKMPAYFYMSQKDNAESPIVYIANYWTNNSSDTITVMSNCDEVELYVNGRCIEKIKPNLYMNLPHPMYEFGNVAF